jgi:hypothetical protein
MSGQKKSKSQSQTVFYGRTYLVELQNIPS